MLNKKRCKIFSLKQELKSMSLWGWLASCCLDPERWGPVVCLFLSYYTPSVLMEYAFEINQGERIAVFI